MLWNPERRTSVNRWKECMAKENARHSKIRSTGQRDTRLAAQYRDIGIKAVAAAAQQKEPEFEHTKKGGQPMSEAREARNFVDKSTKAARETLEEGSAAIEQNFASVLEKTRDLNVKLVEMARDNAEANFDFAREIATAKTPTDLAEALSTHANKQFELFNTQMRELATLAQTIAGSGAEPFTRSFNQVFKGGS
jgi:hypothetical protein